MIRIIFISIVTLIWIELLYQPILFMQTMWIITEHFLFKQDDERRDSIPEEPENQQSNHLNNAKTDGLMPLSEERRSMVFERSQSLAEPMENNTTNHFSENT